MTTATKTANVTIDINANALDFWKESLADDIARYAQEGRIERARKVLTILNRRKSKLMLNSTEEVQEVRRSLRVVMKWIGSPYIQFYFRKVWAEQSKGLVKEVLSRKTGTQMDVRSIEEFDALIADLDSRIEAGQNRKASNTHRNTLVEARDLFAPFEQPFNELDGAEAITEAVESPEAARELLAESDSDSDADNADNGDSAEPQEEPQKPQEEPQKPQEEPQQSQKVGVHRAPDHVSWRVYSEDGSYTEHTSRDKARAANKERLAKANA